MAKSLENSSRAKIDGKRAVRARVSGIQAADGPPAVPSTWTGLSRHAGCVLVVVVAVISGCGQSSPKITPVSGVVRWKGEALANARVDFYFTGKDRLQASGTTDANGVYRLSTKGSNDGAAVGEHRVTVQLVPRPVASPDSPEYVEAMRAMQEQRENPLAPRLPSKYASPETTDLKKTVVAGKGNTIDLELVADE